ncbi:MAG: hypothetical protein IK065_00455 [Neisseriaceae bacterium]|nr:hypothetical protein [Neisseriaceae bacterium]
MFKAFNLSKSNNDKTCSDFCPEFCPLRRNFCKPYQKQKVNPAVGWDNTTHHNAVGVNLLYFNNFLFNPIGRLVSKDARPTAFLFQKLGFAGVSLSLPERN